MFKKLLSILLIFNFLLAANLELTKKEKEYIRNAPEVIVASNDSYTPFSFKKNGELIGFSQDLINIIAQKTGLKFKEVSGRWPMVFNKFKNGEVDILAEMSYKKERIGFTLYTNPYYEIPIGVFTRKDFGKYKGIQSLFGKKLGIVKNSYLSNIVKKIDGIEIIEIDSNDKRFYELVNKDVDAVLSNSMSLLRIESLLLHKEIKLAGIFENKDIKKEDLRFGINKTKPILASIISKTLDSIDYSKITQLKEKWLFSPQYNQDDKILISEKEKEFIKKHPKIRFKVRKNKAPFEFEQNGKAVGIAVDYVRKSAQNVGLEAIFVLSDDSVKKSHNEVLNKKVKYDTLLYGVKSKEREKNFSFGKNFLSYPLMIIANKKSSYIRELSDLNEKTIVLEEGYLTNKWIKKDYPKINILNVKDTKTALSLVNEGKISAYVGNLGVANHMMLFEGMNNLKIAAPSGYKNINFSFISSKDWPQLASLLSKGYSQISSSEHSAIQQKWFSLQTLEKTDYSLVWKILIATFFIFFWFSWWNRKISIEKEKTQEALKKLEKVQEEQLKQQQVILNQSKIADMGEMIGNIAHQWRQPLSAISTLSTGLKLKKEYDSLEDEELLNSLDSINNYAQHLSKTIDTFRNFLSENKDYKEVVLQERLTMALDIYGATLKNHQIEIINEAKNKNNIKVKLVLGELSQVIGNILNNAKDKFLESKIPHRWIKIDLFKESENIIITIEDNAGGIPKEILPKIFDPYFTTKHSSQGTGLGLHMSYRIVKESMKGKLYAKNTLYGAKFYIVLPKSL